MLYLDKYDLLWQNLKKNEMILHEFLSIHDFVLFI